MRISLRSLKLVVGVAATLLWATAANAVEAGPAWSVQPGTIIEAPDGVTRAEILDPDSELIVTLLDVPVESSIHIPSWPIAPGVRRAVTLRRRDIYAEDAKIVKVVGNREVELPRSKLVFFWGKVDGGAGDIVTSVDPDTHTMWGISTTLGGTYEISPPTIGRPHHVLAAPGALRRADEPVPTWTCGQETLETNFVDYLPHLTAEALDILDAPTPPSLTATVAVDTDNEYMAQKFSDNTTNATNYIAQLIAAVTNVYERDALVRVLQGYTILRVSTTADPYTQGPDINGNASGAELTEFGTYWSNHYGSIRRTAAILLSGKQPQSNAASGIAWLNQLCSTSNGYSFNQLFKASYLNGDVSIAAHELGHIFGSPHTHCYSSPPPDFCYNQESGCWSGATSCPSAFDITTASGTVVTGVRGTLMSYCQTLSGCSTANVFHPRSLSEYLNSSIGSATENCIFSIGAASPAITGVDIASGPTTGGTLVTITGTSFRSGATVAFADLTGSLAATVVTFNSSTSLRATTPAHTAGTVDVVVMNPDYQTATLRNGFTFTTGPPPPSVSSVYPNFGPAAGGTGITITGSSFVTGATATLGGTAATGVTVSNSTTITATTAAHMTGLVNVVVQNLDTQTGTLTGGYFYGPPTTTGALFYPLTPCRVLDTRNATGPLGGPVLAAGATRSFTVASTCAIPSNAKTLSVNLTITGPTATGELRVFPGNGTLPSTSSISFRTGQTRANNAHLLLATDGTGSFKVQNNSTGTVHFLVDVNGYYR